MIALILVARRNLEADKILIPPSHLCALGEGHIRAFFSMQAANLGLRVQTKRLVGCDSSPAFEG